MLRSLVGSEMCIRDRFKQLKPGQRVPVQHHVSKDWTIKGTITATRQDGYSYIVQTDEGKSFIRGRRLLKSISNDTSSYENTNPKHTTTSNRTVNHPEHCQQSIPPQLSPQPPQKMPRDQQESRRGSSIKPTDSTYIPTPTVMSDQDSSASQDSSADGGLHLGSSFGAVEYHGITSYQWATLLLLIIIVVWLNLRYRRKSRIASDAKRGILPPRAPQRASTPTANSGPGKKIFAGRNKGLSATKSTSEQCSCARSTSTGGGRSDRFIEPTRPGPDIGQGPWIAHAMIRNQTTKKKKAKGNCWDNRICGKPITDSSDEEELCLLYTSPSPRDS